MDNHDNLSGSNIKGYTLIEQVGRGGFGAVYRAMQASVERDVAMKVILPKFANEPLFVRRFEVEAQLVAKLEHMNIVPLYDFWRDPDGAYLVMRYLRGGTLKDALRQEPWDAVRVARLVKQIAGALTTAHQQNVIHRDLKPANILLDEAGNAFLTDFGIAKILGHAGDPLDQPESLAMSPAYTSPEQVLQEDISPRSDVYSFGVLVYRMFAGTHPFESRKTPLAMLRAHLYDDIPMLSAQRYDLSVEVDEVLAKATAKDPLKRYATVAEFDDALRRALRSVTRQWIETTELNLTEEALKAIRELDEANATMVEPKRNPYRGLQAFTSADSKFFFGRDNLIQRLIANLGSPDAPQRFLAVVGPSGSGKSSVVRAGLLPALRDDGIRGASNWFYATIHPGHHPFDEIEAALMQNAINQSASSLREMLKSDARGLSRAIKRVLPDDDDSELVLVIDQFEELFTLTEDPLERNLLLESLYEALTDPHSRLRVIITLRADYYDRPLMYPEFSALMRGRTEVVLPMTPEELERAIVEPARRVNVQVESALVSAIIGEVSREPGALPLTQYALTELFDARTGDVLTLATYQRLGGVLGALAKRAEAVFAELNEPTANAARQLFSRLVTSEDDATYTRRRSLVNELVALAPNMQKAIDTFGNARLLTFDRDPKTRAATVELAHEAILIHWERLRQWLDDGREDIRQARQVATLAADWAANGRESSFLLRGNRLERLLEWSAESSLSLSDDEQKFLDASRAERDRQQAAEAARITREMRLERVSRDRLRILVVVMSVAAVVAIALSLLAFNQSQTAQDERDRAESARDDAQNAQATADANAQRAEEQADIAQRRSQELLSRSLADNARRALLENDPDTALAFALQAAAIDNAPDGVINLLQEQAASAGTRRLFGDGEAPIWGAALSPDGVWLVTSRGSIVETAEENATAVQIWDVATGDLLRSLDGHTNTVTNVAIHPDGQRIITGSLDRTFRIWDAATGDELGQWAADFGEDLATMRLTPDGSRLITSSSGDSLLRVRSFDTGELLHRMEGHAGSITGLAVHPNSESLFSGGDDGFIYEWNLETGEPMRRFNTQNTPTALALSDDGERLLYGTGEGEIIYASLNPVSILHIFSEHEGDITTLDFLAVEGRDGLALSGSADERVIVWDLATGSMIERLDGHTRAITNTIFQSAQQGISTDLGGTVRVWDFRGDAGLLARTPIDGTAFSVAVAPSGDHIAVGTGSGLNAQDNSFTGIAILAAESGDVTGLFAGHRRGVVHLDYNADGERLLSTSEDRTVRVWDATSGEQLVTIRGVEGVLFRAMFSPDGDRILSGGYENDAPIFDATNGEEVGRLAGGHDGVILSVAYSADGSFALTGGFDNEIVLWQLNADGSDGQMVRRYAGHTGWVSSLAFAPDGESFLSSSFDGSIRWWSAESDETLGRWAHAAEVMRVVWHPNGTWALSSGFDGESILWDVARGEAITQFNADTGFAVDAAFKADGRLAYTTTTALNTWQLPTERDLAGLVAWLETNRYVRPLTEDERCEYRLGGECEED